jgi:DNA polymerase-3 subunit alpha
MEPILKPTYGCIVYQEQVMQIVRELAGYTLGRSDLVRRAMSKKKASVMAKESQNFVYGNEEEGVPGCIANGISEEIANKIYDEMTILQSMPSISLTLPLMRWYPTRRHISNIIIR